MHFLNWARPTTKLRNLSCVYFYASSKQLGSIISAKIHELFPDSFYWIDKNSYPLIQLYPGNHLLLTSVPFDKSFQVISTFQNKFLCRKLQKQTLVQFFVFFVYFWQCASNLPEKEKPQYLIICNLSMISFHSVQEFSGCFLLKVIV